MSAFVALPTTAIYCTTKYAVRGLTESLRIEARTSHIGVSLLCPGGVNTSIHESVLSRPARYGETGYYGADPEVFKRLKSVIGGGIRSDRSRAHRAGNAIRCNEFWILPYPEFIPMLEKYNAQVIALSAIRERPGLPAPQKSGRGSPVRAGLTDGALGRAERAAEPSAPLVDDVDCSAAQEISRRRLLRAPANILNAACVSPPVTTILMSSALNRWTSSSGAALSLLAIRLRCRRRRADDGAC